MGIFTYITHSSPPTKARNIDVENRFDGFDC
jgi:hypothetical protein